MPIDLKPMMVSNTIFVILVRCSSLFHFLSISIFTSSITEAGSEKRARPYSFGLGKRREEDGPPYNFGIGKRR